MIKKTDTKQSKTMGYDWKKICRTKTDKELYLIYLGQKNLSEDAQISAEEELKSRSFDFDNVGKHQKKWELEKLIEEERDAKSLFSFGIQSSKHFLISGIGGALMSSLIILDYFFGFMNSEGPVLKESEIYIFSFLTLGMSAVGFIGYHNKRKREKYRESKMKELIEQL